MEQQRGRKKFYITNSLALLLGGMSVLTSWILLVQGCPRFSYNSSDFPAVYKYFILTATILMFIESINFLLLCKSTYGTYFASTESRFYCNWILRSLGFVLSFGSIIWTVHQITYSHYRINICIDCYQDSSINCSITDHQDYPFSKFSFLFTFMLTIPAVCLHFSVLDGPHICYWFILIGCICSCLPTFAIIHRGVKERGEKARRFETVSSWLKSKDYVEMDDYQDGQENPSIWTTTTRVAKNESI